MARVRACFSTLRLVSSAPLLEASSGSGQQKKDCDAKWGAYKTKTGAHGWHDYFQFMAKCM